MGLQLTRRDIFVKILSGGRQFAASDRRASVAVDGIHRPVTENAEGIEKRRATAGSEQHERCERCSVNLGLGHETMRGHRRHGSASRVVPPRFSMLQILFITPIFFLISPENVVQGMYV